MGFFLAAILGLSFMAVQFLAPPLLLSLSGRMSIWRRLAWCGPAWILLGVLILLWHRRDTPYLLVSILLWLLYLAHLISNRNLRDPARSASRANSSIVLVGVFIAAQSIFAVASWWDSRSTPMLESDIAWPLGGDGGSHVELHLPRGYGFGKYEPSEPPTIRSNVAWPSLTPIDLRDHAFEGFADSVIRIEVSARTVPMTDITRLPSDDVACQFESDATRPQVDCATTPGRPGSGDWHEVPVPEQHDLSLRLHPPTYLPDVRDMYDVWYAASLERRPNIIIQCPKNTGVSDHGPCIHVFALDALNATVLLRYNRLHLAEWQQIQTRVIQALLAMRR